MGMHADFCDPSVGYGPLSDSFFVPCFGFILELALSAYLIAVSARRVLLIRRETEASGGADAFLKTRKWWAQFLVCAFLSVWRLVLLIAAGAAGDLFVADLIARILGFLAWGAVAAVLRIEQKHGYRVSAATRFGWTVGALFAFVSQLSRTEPRAIAFVFIPAFLGHLFLGVLSVLPKQLVVSAGADEPDAEQDKPLMDAEAGYAGRHSLNAAPEPSDSAVWSRLMNFGPSAAASPSPAQSVPAKDSARQYHQDSSYGLLEAEPAPPSQPAPAPAPAPRVLKHEDSSSSSLPDLAYRNGRPPSSSVSSTASGSNPQNRPPNYLGVRVRVTGVSFVTSSNNRPMVQYHIHISRSRSSTSGSLPPPETPDPTALSGSAAGRSGRSYDITRTWEQLEQLHLQLQNANGLTPGAAGTRGGDRRPKGVLLPPLPQPRFGTSEQITTRLREEAQSFFNALSSREVATSDLVTDFFELPHIAPVGRPPASSQATVEEELTVGSAVSTTSSYIAVSDEPDSAHFAPSRPRVSQSAQSAAVEAWRQGASAVAAPELPMARPSQAPFPTSPVPYFCEDDDAGELSGASAYAPSSACPHSSRPHVTLSVPSWREVVGGPSDDEPGVLSPRADEADRELRDVRGQRGSKAHISFTIAVCVNGELTSIEKRFSDVERLHRELAKAYEQAVLPELPPKRLALTARDAASLDARRAALEWYLSQLCASNIRITPEFAEFLQLSVLPAPSFLSRLQVAVPESAEETRAHGPEASASSLLAADSSDPFVAYVVQLRDRLTGRSWQVRKRYSEFVSLHEALRRLPCAYGLPAFPPKSMPLLSKDKVVERRRQMFQEYLREAVETRGHAKVLLSFLGAQTNFAF